MITVYLSFTVEEERRAGGSQWVELDSVPLKVVSPVLNVAASLHCCFKEALNLAGCPSLSLSNATKTPIIVKRAPLKKTHFFGPCSLN